MIDPILVYGSYLGGSLFDSGSGIAVDANGNVYFSGTMMASDFPTVNAYQTTFGQNGDIPIPAAFTR